MRAPDAPPEVDSGPVQQLVEWNGGTLDDLVSLLSVPAWSARVEVLPANGGNAVGEVHVIAGGVSEAIYEGRSTHDALDKLRAVKNTRFRIEPRLPNPSDGDLTFPGPDQGKLEERPLAHLMRYCEDYVLTAGIEVWRGSENAKVDYRRGEIVGVTVGGIDAPERLAEVMKWSSGSYRLRVPRLTLPETAPKAAVPVAVVGARASGATSKTIFGMPALDPATLAAANDKPKAPPAQGGAQSGAQSSMKATTLGMARPSTPANATANNNTHAATSTTAPPVATPVAAPPTATATVTAPVTSSEAPAAASSAHSTASVSKTIFGVQPPAVTPPAAAAAPAASQTATPAPAAAAATSKPATTATAPTSAEQAKPGRATGTASAARAPMAPAIAAEADRTTKSHKETQKNPATSATNATASGETPVWTYVGVGFVFGLALLGVYRLVIVLAH